MPPWKRRTRLRGPDTLHGRTSNRKRCGRKPQRGDYVIYKHFDYDMYFILAQDTGNVTMIDTMHGHKLQTLERKLEGGEVLKVLGPAAWADHNKYKGGVDQSDQVRCNRANGVAMHGRTRKWTRRLLHGGVLDVGITNTYFLQLFIKSRQGKPPLDYTAVLTEIQRGLMLEAYALDKYSMEQRHKLHPKPQSLGSPPPATQTVFADFERWLEGHQLVPITAPRKTREGEDSTRHARANCAFYDCHCVKKENAYTHQPYHQSRAVGTECRRCQRPFHQECFLKEHIHRFLQHKADEEDMN